ncbi:MAG TPA: phospholipase D-like domain-containing protein [Vicinamibacterales bacterium]|nr:phospholipase D-like domain-containing protein [Vicinamibacterales bacterium]
MSSYRFFGRRLLPAAVTTVLLALTAGSTPAFALDRLCDPGGEDCRAILINYIRNENVEIDVAFWFMEDARYTAELANRAAAGVKIRVLVDPRANATEPANADRLDELQNAGLPMRKRIASGILHWKMMLFAGQNVVEFSGANYSADAWHPLSSTPYENYIDEAIYFTDDPAVVNSFKTKYDDSWVDTTSFADYANITGPLTRSYDTFSQDADLNFPPAQSYASRALKAYAAETQKIDVIMYRITDQRHTNAMITAVQRGIPVRLISEPAEYRNPARVWDSWNVDRMYMAGVHVKMRAHAGLTHEKLVLLYGQALSIFGSSNWTSPSDKSQQEHNYFTTKPSLFQWFVDQFERKWNNTGGVTETTDFVPLPPDKPVYQKPSNGATGVSTASVTLKWYGGPWAHLYDVWLGTDPANLKLVLANKDLGPSESSTQFQSFTVDDLQPGSTYYWQVVSHTMANLTKTGPVWTFTTAGTATAPPVNGVLGPGDILLYGDDGVVTGSAWTLTSDGTATDGKRLWNPDKGAAKITTAAATPGSYVEFTFTAVAGTPYHFWMRGNAQNNDWANDSVFVQFSGSVDKSGNPTYRIGTTNAAEYNLENCAGCGEAAWGWQDNAYGNNAATIPIYFTSGPQTLRIQAREDGLSIDQIMFSPSKYFATAPGPLKNDTTIYPRGDGGSGGGSSGLPAPWSNQDIGSVGIAGSASYDDGTATFKLKGAGADVWGTADALQYAYQPLSGDGSIVARVATASGSEAWVKAGVMIRASLGSGSAQAFMLVSRTKGLAFQRRVATGGTSVSTAGAAAAAPYWVRLDRSGNTITAYQSPDGSTWTVVGSDTFSMPANVDIGLGVSSHTNSSVAIATFDHVTISGTIQGPPSLPAPWVNQDVGAVGRAGSASYDANTSTFTVQGAGADVWGTADALQYVYQPLSGDGSVVARVASVGGTEAWTKAGVMIRDSLSPDSAQAFMLVSRGKGVAFQRRTTAGGGSVSASGAAATAPYWVRLDRSGATITAYQSPDGVAWTSLGSDTFDIGTNVYVGLGVSSHTTSSTAAATFDHVDVSAGQG